MKGPSSLRALPSNESKAPDGFFGLHFAILFYVAPALTFPSVTMTRKCLILIAFIGILGPFHSAQSEELAPSTQPPAPDKDPAPLDNDASLVGNEVVEMWGSREDRSFDRDTTLKLTGAELRKRGIGNLAQALDTLPEINVRASGRGGRQIDIRGARKGSVKILLDGISISDPFYGNIDLSSIPVTDIEEIRISTSPASPIDGVGGPGGVIEILTSDAVGTDRVRARVSGGSDPSGEASATGRVAITPHFGLRMSASGIRGAKDYQLRLQEMPSAPVTSFLLPEDRDQSVGSVRLEYRKDKRRLVADIWLQQVAFVVPPAIDGLSRFLVIDGESQGRIGVAYDDQWQGFRVQGRGHFHLLSRQSTYFEDPQLTMSAQAEDLDASRSGAALVVNRPIGSRTFLIASANLESDQADVQGFDGEQTQGRSTIAQGAIAAHWDSDKLAVRAATGYAIPIGIDADPWVEFKVAVDYTPVKSVHFKAVTGHKGRTPSLRERLRLDIGNESLGPEKAYFGELGVTFTPKAWLDLQTQGFVRNTNGLIRFDPQTRVLSNTKELQIHGLEVLATLRPVSWFALGANWSFSEAHSEILGKDPLDFFPEHRGSGWFQLRRKGYGMTTRLQYWGQQIDRDTEISPKTLLQTSLHASIAERYLLTLRAENLMDTVHDQRFGVRAPGRTVFAAIEGEWK